MEHNQETMDFEQTDPKILYQNGINFEFGRNGVTKNAKKAIKCFISASNKYAPAQFKLAQYLAKKGNWRTCIFCLRKSAVQNYPPAQFALARCIAKGKCKGASPTEAGELFQKAAGQGYVGPEFLTASYYGSRDYYKHCKDAIGEFNRRLYDIGEIHEF